MEKIKVWSDVIATWVTIIGAFIGGIFALVQYHDKISGDKVENTLKYVDRFNKDSLLNARLTLDAFWNAQAELVFSANKKSSKDLSNFVVATIKKNEQNRDLCQITGFFDNIEACVSGKVCDEDTAKRFFGKYAFDFFGLFYPYIKEQRQRLQDESFGIGVEVLAKSYKSGSSFKEVSDEKARAVKREK